VDLGHNRLETDKGTSFELDQELAVRRTAFGENDQRVTGDALTEVDLFVDDVLLSLDSRILGVSVDEEAAALADDHADSKCVQGFDLGAEMGQLEAAVDQHIQERSVVANDSAYIRDVVVGFPVWPTVLLEADLRSRYAYPGSSS